MLNENQIETLGQITRQKIAEAVEVTREAIAGQDQDIQAKHLELLQFVEKELNEADGRFQDRLQDALEQQRVIHSLEVDAVKADLAEQKKVFLAELLKGGESVETLQTEITELDTALAERLQEELEKQQVIHRLEIEELKHKLAAQQDSDAELAERIATIKDGEQGEQGKQGEPGIDGLDRPLIEPTSLQDKDYPKGTLGTFAGGLWISTKQAMGSPHTDALAWHCILDAMDTVEIDLQDDGSYLLSVRMSTGRVIANTLHIPYPEHCGIWEERDYLKGQIVTKGSSMWQAMQDTAGQPPGNGWRQILSAVRGKPGTPGKPGAPGKPGRNAQLDEDLIADLKEMVAQWRGQENA